jgi:hypothetical protein
MGLVKEWTDGEIINLITEAQGALGRRGKPINQIALTEDVMIEETGEVFTIERNAEEILTQHDKRVGVVEKLKNCL